MSTLRHQVSKFRTIIIILIIVIVLLAGFIVSRQAKNAALPALATQKVQLRNVQRSVTGDGKISGIDTRSVYLPVSYTVKEVDVVEGDSVTQDQVLFLVQTGKTKLEIKSPIAGHITEVNYQVNDQVINPNLVGATVVDYSKYKIDLAVNEADIIDVKPGQMATMIFPAIDLDKTYNASVDKISSAPITGATGVNYNVSIKPAELPVALRLGMSVDVEIVTARAEDVLAVPDSYLIERDQKFFLKVITWRDEEHSDYTTEEKEVTLGLRSDEYTQIKAGVKEGDEILDPSFTVQRKFSLF